MSIIFHSKGSSSEDKMILAIMPQEKYYSFGDQESALFPSEHIHEGTGLSYQLLNGLFRVQV